MPEISALLFFGFLVVLYLITFLRYRRNKRNTDSIDTVKTFRDTYRKRDDERNRTAASSRQTGSYVTKFNSSEDYREKSQASEHTVENYGSGSSGNTL